MSAFDDVTLIYRDYFMESACVRDFHMSWWSIWNRTSERSERVRFLIQNQRVWKSRTKRFPWSNLYYMEESVLLGTKPLVDSIRHFIRDPSGIRYDSLLLLLLNWFLHIIKRTLHVGSKIWIFVFSWQEQYLTIVLATRTCLLATV